MKKTSNILKGILIGVMFLVLFFPVLQNNLNFFEIKPLKGSFEQASKVDFSFPLWINGIFQECDEKYLTENFGLRNTCVRMNNQLRFEIFKTTSNAETVFGKDGYFFAKAYISSYTGENFIGIEPIIAKCKLVKELQDSLSKLGQIFLPILAPNKARVLTEYLPDGTYKKSMSNYEVFVALFKKFKINYIDFNKYFLEANKTSKYKLFTKYGIHWSSYGHTLAADSIINYINYHYGLNMPTMVWKNDITLSDSLRNQDYDIGEGMNLLVEQLPSEKVAYPNVSYRNSENKKPSVFVIGDSFTFGLEKTNFQNKAFSDYKFLYYFEEVIPYVDDKAAFYKLNLVNELKSHKVTLLVATEHNLTNYGWGFLETATGLLNGKINKDELDYENKIHILEYDVRKNTEWFNKIKQQAIIENKNLDTLVYLNAKYLIENSPANKNNSVENMKSLIKTDNKWMEDIEKKARERKISVDSMLTIDANWAIEHAK